MFIRFIQHRCCVDDDGQCCIWGHHQITQCPAQPPASGFIFTVPGYSRHSEDLSSEFSSADATFKKVWEESMQICCINVSSRLFAYNSILVQNLNDLIRKGHILWILNKEYNSIFGRKMCGLKITISSPFTFNHLNRVLLRQYKWKHDDGWDWSDVYLAELVQHKQLEIRRCSCSHCRVGYGVAIYVDSHCAVSSRSRYV